jgi:hypothetical protein
MKGLWIGFLSSIGMGVASIFYTEWKMNQYNKEYRETYENGLQKLEARIAELKERTKT